MTIPKDLHELGIIASDWAAEKLQSGAGWTALMMVMKADGQTSATIYQQDAWEAALILAQDELTAGHYKGNLMYVLARHVSWQSPDGMPDQHAIMMHGEARGVCPPMTFCRPFDTAAPAVWIMKNDYFGSEPLGWSAYE